MKWLVIIHILDMSNLKNKNLYVRKIKLNTKTKDEAKDKAYLINLPKNHKILDVNVIDNSKNR